MPSGFLIVPNKLLIPTLLVFVISLPLFARLVYMGVGPGGETTDYRLHVALALDVIRKKELMPHPYSMVYCSPLSGEITPTRHRAWLFS